MAQWIRIRLPVQGMWVPPLIREDPTHFGAIKPTHHNCRGHRSRPLKPVRPAPVLHKKPPEKLEEPQPEKAHARNRDLDK